MRLCAERVERARMTDSEFWEHVFGGRLELDPDDFFEPPPSPGYPTPCVVCGEYGPCGYDDLGRPLLHAPEDVEP